MANIESIFENAAENTFGRYGPRKVSKSKNVDKHKKWFNGECRTARRIYHSVRRMYNLHKNEENRMRLSTVSKTYKRAISKSIIKYKRDFKHKIRTMRQKSPKDYWRYINSLNFKTVNADISIEQMYEHFKTMNEMHTDDENVPDSDFLAYADDPQLNTDITESEIRKGIKSLKNNKSPGIDNILNEYIKRTEPLFMSLYVKTFNVIFDTGVLPDSWLNGIIMPIYKNKGNVNDPNEYRPITILSCLGKLFTAILNNRINSFLDNNKLLNENQSGFRKDHSTSDNIFILHSIIEYMKARKMKLFCTFVDFSKAFDTVWRTGLWSKLLKYNIKGKLLTVIQNMYDHIRSCVHFNGDRSMFFQCNNGLRQGENLSPVLISLFLNDLEHHLSKNNSVGLNLYDCDLRSFLKIIVLLYADDTVLFAESEEEMQLLLNDFSSYCKTWKLNINNDKTKLLVFGHRSRRKCNIYLNETLLEMVEAYKYLGVMFSKTRSFNLTKKHVVEQARKALFSLYKKIRNLDLPIDCQIKLFDNTVLPILTYACEVWGFGDLTMIDKVQTDFFKHILHVKNSTPHIMLYGELGRFPISLIIKQRMVKFWEKLVSDRTGKLSSFMYRMLFNDMSQDFCTHSWLKSIKGILDSVGLSYVWNQQELLDNSSNWLSKTVREILELQFKQQWHSSIQESSKCLNYRMYKSEHKFENYLKNLPAKLMQNFINFRLCNNKLPIETVDGEILTVT